MAGLCWMAVTLGLLLSVGNSSAQVKSPGYNRLRAIVNELWDSYSPSYTDSTGESKTHMFSLAVRIPYTEDNNKKKEYDVSQVIDADSPDKVKKSILSCEVYKGTRVVAATVLKWPDVLEQCPNEKVQWSIVGLKKVGIKWDQLKKAVHKVEFTTDHAEYRVLQNFDTLKKQNENDFMLFYVLASPCVEKCTNKDHDFNILTKIKVFKEKWKNFAFVFSYLFKPPVKTVPDKELIGALKDETARKEARKEALKEETARKEARKEETARKEARKEALMRLGLEISLENIYRCTEYRCSCCFDDAEAEKVTKFCY